MKPWQHRILISSLLTALTIGAVGSALGRMSVEFSEAELAAIYQKYGQIHLNLINDYLKTIESYRELPKDKQLAMVNGYLNSLLPGYDSDRNNQEEYWSTPKEFLAMGTGDCEDYVAIKYFTLIDLGFDEKKLFFAIVREMGAINHHMVLLYEQVVGEPPLVLDNLSFRVLPLPARYDLDLKEFFNTTGRFIYDNSYRKIRLEGQNSEFVKLRDRVQRGE